MADNAMIVPVLWMPVLTLTAPYVPTDWLDRGSISWQIEDTWMEPH
jgi:hypothetical protein